MTETLPETRGAVPDWSLGWRLRRALAHGELTTEQIADELGVPRSAVSRWCNDHTRPTRGYLKLIAMRCGVSYAWLASGIEPIPATRGGDGAAGLEALPLLTVIDNSGYGYWGRLPRKDSNLQPAVVRNDGRPSGRAAIIELRKTLPIRVDQMAARTADSTI